MYFKIFFYLLMYYLLGEPVADFKIKITSKAAVIKSSLIYIDKHFNGLYGQLLTFLILSSKIIELFVLSIFLKEKRSLLKKIWKF